VQTNWSALLPARGIAFQKGKVHQKRDRFKVNAAAHKSTINVEEQNKKCGKNQNRKASFIHFCTFLAAFSV